MPPPDPIAAAVDAARAELLDPGLRNPLVQLRVHGTRAVEIVDERTVEAWRRLVGARAPMDFLPVGDETGDPDELGQPAHAGGPGRHVDAHLQTPYRSVVLQRRLMAVARASRVMIEEQGHNALALALGMLHWTHGDASLRSPLLLLPAMLDRTNARCRYTVRYSEEEIGGNLSLAALLKADEGFELPLPEVHADFDPGVWFDTIEAAVAGRPGWRVERDEMVLGLFDSKRFLLYRDLDPGHWPAGEAPHQHRLVRAVLGEGFPEADDGGIEGTTEMARTIEVVDADTSQSAALQLVAGGRDIVVQGPPGTGKSQTITNLVAQAVARGERVLFVAEKMAALDVVHRRLEQVGLGAACLELHSHKSRKKTVLDELRRTLDLGKPVSPPDAEAERMALAAVTGRLEAHHRAMTRSLDPPGLDPTTAIGRWHLIDDAGRLPRLPFGPMAHWRSADQATHRERVGELMARVADLGVPAEHPFHGCQRTALPPAEAEALAVTLDRGLAAMDEAVAAHTALAAEVGLAPPTAPRSADKLRAIATALADAPSLNGMMTAEPGWTVERDALSDALSLADTINGIREPWLDALLEEAWPEDVLASTAALVEARGAITALSGKWWRWFSGRWRQAKATVDMLFRDDLPDDPPGWVAALSAVLDTRSRVRELSALAPIAASLFRTRWADRHPDARGLRAAFDWLSTVHGRIADGTWPPELQNRLATAWRRDALREALDRVAAAEVARVDALTACAAALRWAGPALMGLAFDDMRGRLRTWRDALDRFGDYCRYARLARQARSEGLGPVVDLAETWPEAGARLLDAFDGAWLHGVLETARAERPPFADFDRVRHLHAVERFRTLDRQRFGHDRAEVALAHFGRLPRGNSGPALSLLRREMEKKTRHLPLRKLFVEAREAVQAIKPVFLMSPMSVAAYLDPAGPRFDLVVFDEASQVRPVDALGALARSKRAVVVGDSKQMPPTRFFERLLDSGDLLDGEDNVTADLESLLGLFVAAGADGCMLRWHYRSRHPSLVAVSNHLFYGAALTLFPSPVREPEADGDLGLSYRHLPDAIYERGASRTNPIEADAVADAVLRHAVERPDLTLGVVAFSTAQMGAIIEAIERRRRTRVEGEAFFAAHVHEPFFVKNLENVQGDERDVILISVGYGRTAEGRVYPQFGPLNLDGGERRLNVLITRARRRCVVFTNLEPEEIDLSRTKARGVSALRTFLAYARDGHLGTGAARQPIRAPLEDAIAEALAERGHTVHRRVGDAGCAVALAIVDPEEPGQYLLGVDCDGAIGRRRTRDRIRLRPAVLRDLGWQLHRVWAAAWHRDPDGAIARVEAAIAAAREEAVDEVGPEPLPTVEREPGAVARPDEAIAFSDFTPYDPWNGMIEGQFVGAMPADADTIVMAIARHEAPLTVAAIARRITQAGGANRCDQTLTKAVGQVVGRLVDNSALRRTGAFVSLPGSGRPSPRNRRKLYRWERTSRSVPPAELEATLIDTLRQARVMPEDELIATGVRRLGLPRSEGGRHRSGPWETALGQLIADGRARRHDIEVIWQGS